MHFLLHCKIKYELTLRSVKNNYASLGRDGKEKGTMIGLLPLFNCLTRSSRPPLKKSKSPLRWSARLGLIAHVYFQTDNQSPYHIIRHLKFLAFVQFYGFIRDIVQSLLLYSDEIMLGDHYCIKITHLYLCHSCES